MTRIDLHCHVFPPAYDAQLPAGGFRGLPGPKELLSDMDRFEIDASVVSMGGPVHGGRSPAELCRLVNEGYAELVAEHPARLGALASLPLPDVDAALAELDYALDTLGLDGVLLLSNHEGVYLGDERLEPLFAELDRRAAYCFVHPDFPPDWPLPQHPGRWYEFPFDTTRAMVNLALSGGFDRFPNVRMQWAHLGGTVPYLARRIDNQSRHMPDAVSKMSSSMLECFSRQYYDTGLSAYYGTVAATLGITSLSHVVFGTDWPWYERPEHGSDPEPELSVLGPDRAQVDSLNAASLVPALAARMSAARR